MDRGPNERREGLVGELPQRLLQGEGEDGRHVGPVAQLGGRQTEAHRVGPRGPLLL